MRDRIRPSRNHDDFLNRLREDGLFETRQKAMVFAAALGFKLAPEGPVQPLAAFGEGIPISVFERANDMDFVDALAITYEGHLGILDPSHDDRRLEIFEFFAQLGLEHIERECYRSGRAPIDGLTALVDDHADWRQPAGDLPGIEDSISRLRGLL